MADAPIQRRDDDEWVPVGDPVLVPQALIDALGGPEKAREIIEAEVARELLKRLREHAE